MKIKIGEVVFKVDSTFHPMFWKYVNNGNWENDSFKIIDAFTNEDSIAIDLGCWIGPLTLYMAAKGVIVHAIDPDSKASQSFLQNLNLNPNLKNKVQFYNEAIGPKTDQQVLYARTGYGNSSSSLLKRTRDKLEKETVQVYTLSSFLEKHKIEFIDFLKIDIEGGEFAIINQLLDLKKRYRTLYLSLHYDHLNESMYQQKIGNRFLSLSLMKLEKIFGFHLFKTSLLNQLDEVSDLAKIFEFIYSKEGIQIEKTKISGKYLLKNKPDLLLSDMEWKK